MRAIALGFVVVVLGLPAAAQAALPNRPGLYAPRDTCAADPGARAFVAGLRDVQKRRDLAALRALADPEITVDFGGDTGPEALGEKFTTDPAQWARLGETLAHGCKLDGDKLTLPWFFTLDFGNADMTVTLLAGGPAVPLYQRGNARSKMLHKLNWQLVEVVGEWPGEGRFVRVRLPGTRVSGYVAAAQLRSQLDQRVVAVRRGGAWKLTAMVEGD